MMDYNKLKGILGVGDKSSNHSSSSSESPKQKRIDDLKTLVQRLQQRLRIYEDPVTMKTFMDIVDEYNTKEEQDAMDEEIVRPSQLRSFLESKKLKDKHAGNYDYQKRYDECYHDEDYYNPKVDILKFDGRIDTDEFLD